MVDEERTGQARERALERLARSDGVEQTERPERDDRRPVAREESDEPQPLFLADSYALIALTRSSYSLHPEGHSARSLSSRSRALSRSPIWR